MRRLFLLLWLLIPVVAFAYHLGPGQRRLALDDAQAAIAAAEHHASLARAAATSAGDDAAAPLWAQACAACDDALRLLPTDLADARRAVRLERAKAQLQIGQLPAANADLQSLVTELTADAAADPAQLTDARAALASSQYYLTWLMRLEGAAREVWEPEIEVARQHYRLLAEQAEDAGDDVALARVSEDLESTIRLARMDLTELQGLPLPNQ